MAKYSRVKQSGDVTNFTSTAELPLSGLRRGETAFANNSLYISNGSGWYRITLVNESPSITLDSEAVSLGSSGNTVTVGYTVVEPEGTPVNVTATTTANTSQANVTINSSNNSLTIENLSAEAFSANVILSATDGVNIGTDSLVLTVAYLSELWDETVLSIGTSSTNSLDNSTFIDRSTNAHTVTATGSPVQTAFHPYLDHYSMDFDGNHSITVPTISSGNGEGLYTTGNSFTLESWVYFKSWNATSQGYNEAILTSSVAVGTSAPWCLGVDDVSGTKKIITQYWDGSTVRYVRGDSSLELNTWYHFAWSVDSGKVRLFINGIQETVTTNMTLTDGYPTIATPAQTTGWHIGQDRGRKSDMYIMNWRLVNGYALYSANFTPSETIEDVTGTWMMLTGNNRSDKSSNDQTVASYFDPPPISAFNPFGQGSEYAVGENKGATYFDGSGDYLSTVNTITIGTNAFTLELWAYIPDLSTEPTLISLDGGASRRFFFGYLGGNWIFRYSDSSDITFSGLELNQWAHIAVAREGYGTNETKIYVNGVLSGTGTVAINYPAEEIKVGTGRTTGNNPLKGYASDIRLTIGTALYTSDFTPPTAPLGNTNASLYLPMDNAGIYDKTGLNTLTTVGNASTSTTQTKFADTAMYFDGTGDYITEESSPSYGYGTSDFTIEFWMYLVGTSTRTVFSNLSSASGTQPHLYTNGTDLRFYTAGGDRIASGSLNANQWYHVSLCKGSSNTRLFIDGTQVGSTYADTNNYGSSAPLGIGTYHNPTPVTTSTMSGYLENLQILKGVAKYTANFTPPTQTQGRAYQAGS